MARLFDKRFLDTVRNLITQHHTVYPNVPPQGIYFEALIYRAFQLCGRPDAHIEQMTPASPQDLVVANKRISLKTETGRSTRPELITITKLCTTEREPWEPKTLIQRTMQHLSRYHHILMLRALWPEEQEVRVIHYQLLEVPTKTLKLIHKIPLSEVGRRQGRRSLAGDLLDPGGVVFRVHFDGADGKCQIRNLPLRRCQMLLEWDQRIG